ncbi:MAG: hypothetical protein CVV49_03760 [Spirochaetae bacterium HGW-Spirochaetae-5]|nr:MAG: hypothetical protein CVV49_03760 [Spirochaetae bacterium HGW-Spirochaetae-5]
MNRKVKDLRVGIRLDIKKPPKVEIPKNVYNRKVKHRKGTDNENSAPFFIPSLHFNHLQHNLKKSLL